MVGTLTIHGSGDVLAPLHNGELIRGRRQDIIVTAFEDPEVPESVQHR